MENTSYESFGSLGFNSVAYCLVLDQNVRLNWAKNNYPREENRLHLLWCMIWKRPPQQMCKYTIVSVYTYKLMWVVLFDCVLFDSFCMETVTSVNRNRSIDEHAVSIELWMLNASLGTWVQVREEFTWVDWWTLKAQQGWVIGPKTIRYDVSNCISL